MLNQYHFEVTGLSGDLDKEAGVIRGVSVITGGVQAKGHNLEVDATTLAQMHALGEKKGQVPVKWNHKTGADAVNGFFTNFRIEGTKLKADWHLLKSHGQYSHAMELAERMPENVGFSASFMGLSELSNGTKVYNPDAKTKHHYTMLGEVRVKVPATEKIFARCQDLISVDLVASPAANPDGMFETGEVDTPGDDMSTSVKPGDNAEQKTTDFAAFMQEQREFNTNVANFLQNFSDEDEDGEATEAEAEAAEAAQEAEVEAEDFSTMADVVQHFNAKFEALVADKEFAAEQEAQQELSAKFQEMQDLNEQLSNENGILAEAYKTLSEKTSSEVEFSAGTDGARKAVVTKAGGAPKTDFEARVIELSSGEGENTKSHAEALIFAVNEDTDRYQTHLQAKGAGFQSL